MWLTSYIDNSGNTAPIAKLDVNTERGISTTSIKTENFAESDENVKIPENTRANPADRIKRYREGISWEHAPDSRRDVLSSEMFKKSASLFIHCVLSPVYGEPVSMEIYNVIEMRDRRFPGREFFVSEIVKTLYGDGGNDTIICIKHGRFGYNLPVLKVPL